MSKFNICVVMPMKYIHSRAFIELAELIYYSLKELGNEVRLQPNKIEKDSINIVIGCHLLNTKSATSLPESTIIVNTEQIFRDSVHWNRNIFYFASRFETWDYSQKNMEKLSELGIKTAKLLRIGFQKELVRIESNDKQDVDVLFYGSMNERRKIILDRLANYGIKTKYLFAVYGKERDAWISRSKIVLNHHFYKSEIFEVVRVFYLLTNSKAVVGEVNSTIEIDEIYKNGIYPAEYDQLAAKCIELIKDESLRKTIQAGALEAIKKFPQSDFTQALINYKAVKRID